jgi:glycerate kinase
VTESAVFIEPSRSAPVVVLAPDSFKGSLDAPAVAAAIEIGIRRVWPDVEVRTRPMADGGEGTLDAVLASAGPRGERRTRSVRNAAGAPQEAAYGLLQDDRGPTAVLEAAQIVGITDALGVQVPVSQRDTRGIGELIRALLDQGVRRFMIGLGGSSTNDGGAGLLAALGLELTDASGNALAPSPAGLADLARVNGAALDPRLTDASITILSDVDNPLSGERGATTIFGPQKGVQPAEVKTIDDVLRAFAAKAEAALGREAASQPGAGAAGGLGFALRLLGGTFASGAEIVADLVGLDAALQGAGWAITGEGRTDGQTLLGKAPFVVAQRAARASVPVTLLSGAVDAAALADLGRVFAGCFVLPSGPMSLERCIAEAPTLLADRAEALARLFGAARAR